MAEMTELQLEEPNAADLDQLAEIWESAVRSTHHFLRSGAFRARWHGPSISHQSDSSRGSHNVIEMLVQQFVRVL